jgi:hypothetical protein
VVDQKVTVTVDEVDGHATFAELCKRFDDRLQYSNLIIVADPKFIQVAQDIKCIGIASLIAQKLNE